MSGIRKAENTLFDQWETAFSGGGYFSRDGVVNPGQWESEREFRLLFLMKDTDGCGRTCGIFLIVEAGGRPGIRWSAGQRRSPAGVPQCRMGKGGERFCGGCALSI